MKVIEIQCRCGAIEIKLTGEPAVQLYCHCDDCRSAYGSAYISTALYPAISVQVTRGKPTPIAVKNTQRMRCTVCGTHLFSEITRVSLRGVNGFLLPKGEFNPQFHVQCQHAVLPVVDNLPHYKGFPGSFGGVDEFVAW